MKYKKSSVLYNKGLRHLVGSVNSPVRAFASVGGNPLFIKEAKGSRIIDVDGNNYVDLVLSYGPMVLGHRHKRVEKKLSKALKKGYSFGASTEAEIELAQLVCDAFKGMDKVRFVNSGTEAVISGVRLARAFTRRDKIIKFEGCYHGHSDSLLVKAGSGALTLGVPSSPGVPNCLADHTITLSYNDIEQVAEVFSEIGDQIACIIVEPVVGNMNCVPPIPGFLEELRSCCNKSGALLIVDEVMTGFRISQQGAIGYYNIDADLICLGKVIGGGMPVGAFGGKRQFMEYISPLGPVYQAGTLSGNPVAMASGLATLELISEPGFLEPVCRRTSALVNGLVDRAQAAGIPLTSNHVGTMWGIFFSDESKIINYDQVMRCNKDRFARFFHGMLREGVYLAPASFEAGFMSSAHTDEDIQFTLEASERVFASLD